MKRFSSVLFCLAFAMLSFLSVATAQSVADQNAPATANAEDPIRLQKVDWKVEGRSRPFALLNASEIKGVEQFMTKADFEAWVAERRQILMNQRVLESVAIEVSYDEKNQEGFIPANLLIKVKDTWNIIALPYPKYDSNDGLEFIIKARDYNFLGTMQPLRFDFGYTIEPEPFKNLDLIKGSFVTEIDSNIPFSAFGYIWNFDFDHYFAYTYQDPFQYWNKTGVSLTLPIGLSDLTFGLYQGFFLNNENGDDYKAKYGERLDGWYLSNWFETNWSIPTGVKANGWGELKYIPRLIVKNNYLPGGGDIGEERRGPTLEVGHSLTFGRVDWVDNFRRGLTITLDNGNIYNFADIRWEKSLTAVVAAYAPLASFLGFSTRLSSGAYLDRTNTTAGVALRGIINDSVHANYFLYFNFDLPVKLITFTPSKWFGKKWMHFFDFEQHWSPFLDVGLAHDNGGTRTFSLSDPLIAAGLEVITFSHYMRSLYLRISAGYDIGKVLKTNVAPKVGDMELFIGLNHAY